MTQEDRLIRTMTWAGTIGAAFALACAYLVLDYGFLNFLTTNFEPDEFLRTMMMIAFPAMVAFLLGHFAERKYYQLVNEI